MLKGRLKHQKDKVSLDVFNAIFSVLSLWFSYGTIADLNSLPPLSGKSIPTIFFLNFFPLARNITVLTYSQSKNSPYFVNVSHLMQSFLISQS